MFKKYFLNEWNGYFSICAAEAGTGVSILIIIREEEPEHIRKLKLTGHLCL